MDVATRWNFSTDSAETAMTAVSQVSVARPTNPTVAALAPPSNERRVQTAVELAMQELDRALDMKRKHRARIAELSCSEVIRAA